MTDHSNQSPQVSKPLATDSKRSTRRRFVEGGAAGSVLAVFYPKAGFSAQQQSSHSAACSFVGSDRACTLGLSQGFWRNHKDLWDSRYDLNKKFDIAFDLDNIFGSMTLEMVIECNPGNGSNSGVSTGVGGSGNKNGKSNASAGQSGHNDTSFEMLAAGDPEIDNDTCNLGRQAVAALQNAATPVPYRWSVEEVRAKVQSAFKSGTDIERVKNDLEAENIRSSEEEEKRLLDLLKPSKLI